MNAVTTSSLVSIMVIMTVYHELGASMLTLDCSTFAKYTNSTHYSDEVARSRGMWKRCRRGEYKIVAAIHKSE